MVTERELEATYQTIQGLVDVLEPPSFYIEISTLSPEELYQVKLCAVHFALSRNGNTTPPEKVVKKGAVGVSFERVDIIYGYQSWRIAKEQRLSPQEKERRSSLTLEDKLWLELSVGGMEKGGKQLQEYDQKNRKSFAQELKAPFGEANSS